MNVVFYHKNCNDGLVSAYNVWEHNKTNTLCIPITYAEFEKQTPDEFFEMCFSDKIVLATIMSDYKGTISNLLKNAKTEVTAYLVDISVPKETLRRISETFKRVVVLDHHPSAEDMYSGDPEFTCKVPDSAVNIYSFSNNVIIAMDQVKSGAAITWLFMNPNKEDLPREIKLVSDYDTWKKEDKTPDWFAAGLRGKNFKNFHQVGEALKDVEGTIAHGRILDDYRELNSKVAIKRRTYVTVVHGNVKYKAAIVNNEMALSSIIGNVLVTEYDYDIGMTYCILSDGEVAWSIRSKKPFSCRFVAEHFGGGGHEQACGFSTSLEKLTEIIKTKTIVIG